MKLIKPSYEILEQAPGLEGIYEAIERAGRTCYKSERPEGKTAKDFVDMLIKRGHLSPLEHGTVYLMIPITTNHSGFSITKYQNNPYSRVVATSGLLFNDEYGDPCDMWCITSNLRVLYENDLMEDLENYLCKPTEYHEKRVGVRVNCSIGISREWNRHRTLSVCEQSTRYCNYSNDKFGNELTFVIPSWAPSLEPGLLRYSPFFEVTSGEIIFMDSCRQGEIHYLNMVKEGLIAQQAREVLPLSTATEVVYTGFISDWQHFFQMRCSSAAHPDIRAIAIPLKEEFVKRGYGN